MSREQEDESRDGMDVPVYQEQNEGNSSMMMKVAISNIMSNKLIIIIQIDVQFWRRGGVV